MQSFLRNSFIYIFIPLLCARIARAMENYPEIKLDACPEVEANFTNLIDTSDPGCRNVDKDDLYSLFDYHPLGEVFHLNNSKMVIILAENTSDAVNLARFLTNDNKLLPQKKRDLFNTNTKFQYDFVVDNFLAYENRNQSVTFVAYPRHTGDDILAEKTIIESVRYAQTIQLILTLPHFDDQEINAPYRAREENVHRLFEIAGNVINNVKNYRDSYVLVVTRDGNREIVDPVPEDPPILQGMEKSSGNDGGTKRNTRGAVGTQGSHGKIRGSNGRIRGINGKTKGVSKISRLSRGNIANDQETGGIEETGGNVPKVSRDPESNEGVEKTIENIPGINGEPGSNKNVEEPSRNTSRIHGELEEFNRNDENDQNPKETIRETKETNGDIKETCQDTQEPDRKISSINEKIRQTYTDLVRKYATNPNATITGKLLAKMIKRDNVVIEEFTSSDQEKLLDHLSKMDQVEANTYDFESQMHRFLKCLFHSIDGKLTSAMGSIISLIRSKLLSTESEMTTLQSVFTISDNLNTVTRALSTFLNCALGNVKIFFNKCSSKFVQDLETLDLDLSAMISINENFSILCWIDHFFYTTQSQYDNNSGNWIKVITTFLDELNYPRTYYWNLKRIHHELEARKDSLSLDEIDKHLGDLITEIIAHVDYNVAFMKNAAGIVKEDLRKATIRISCQRDSIVKLQVTGEFLRLSQILNDTLCRNYQILEIFALEKIVIDRDLIATGRDLLVTIFAPVWEVVMSRRIILDGASQNMTQDDYTQTKARNGNTRTNRNGVDGLAGLPGGPAGAFYGLAEEIIGAENLTISLNGGNGGNGQDGGDGAMGEDGETPSEKYIHSMFNHLFCRWLKNYEVDYRVNHSSTWKYYIPPLSSNVRLRYRDECYIFGLNGFPGGNGGDGGVNGKGGSGGQFHLYPLKSSAIPVVVITANGTDGKHGIGGKKGSGGYTRKVTIFNEDYFNHKVVDNATDERASDGRNGKDNSSTMGSKIQQEVEIRQTFPQTVNLYKWFILKNVKTTPKYLQLYKKIISNEGIMKTYDSLSLVNELIDLENYYFRVNHKNEMLFMYKSWKERLIHYSWHRTDSEQTEEYITLLRNLNRMVSEKIHRLETNSNERLIFILADYLLQCDELVKHLQNARTVVRIKSINSKFTKDYDDKVKEAQQIIQEKLQKDIQGMNQNLKGETEMLLRKISSLTERERKSSEALSEKSKAIEGRLMAKGINEILELINTVLGVINPALARIGTKFSAAGSIVQNFIDETADSSIVEVAIPKIVDRSREFFDNWVDLKCEFDEMLLAKSLEVIEEKRMELRQKGVDVKPLESVATSVAQLRDFASDSEKLPENDIAKLLDDRLTKEESIWQKLNKNKKHIYDGALKAINQIRTFTRMKKMLGDLTDKFKDVKNQRHLDEMNAEIHKAFEKTVKLRNFKEEVYTRMIPLIQKIRDETDLNSKVAESSVAFLDFKKFQMKAYFQQVLQQLELFINQFKLQTLFETTMTNMRDVIDMVLSTYERIQEYVETMKKANYEKDLYLAPFDVTYIKNSELSMRLAKMVQTIYANIVLDNYTKWMASFKQYTFPFADEFLVFESPLPELTGILAKAEEAGKRLHLLGEKLARKRAEFGEFEKTYPAKFGYNLPPFHVWNSSTYGTEINRILKGDPVTLFADINEHKIVNAVKFREVWLRLRSIDPSIKEDDLRRDLKGFAFKLVHDGDSYYRCDSGVYLIFSNSHLFENVYNVLDDDEFRENDGNGVPSGKQKGDYLLSPYATWKIELTSRDVDKGYEMLHQYQSKINIELVGLGQYTDRHLDICTSNLTEYYSRV